MDDSRLYRLMCAAQARVRTESFVPMGDDDTGFIKKENVVLLKEVARMGEEPFRYVEKPGIVITPPKRWEVSPYEGEVNRDKPVYRVAFQIAANDPKRRWAHFRTFSKWEEQVTKLFLQQRLSGADFVEIAHIERVDVFDERLWVTDPHLFVGGVVVGFKSCEDRS